MAEAVALAHVQEHVAPAHSVTSDPNGGLGALPEGSAHSARGCTFGGFGGLPAVDPGAPPALHIDMIRLSQEHAYAPEWGKSRLYETDLDSGEVLWQSTRSDWLEGSFSTKALLRSSGGVVQLMFNPSKWGRPDAVSCGCRTMGQAIAVANEVLRAAGLPEFTFPDRVVLSPSGRGVDTVRQGPRVHEVHIAAVRVLGDPSGVGCYLDWLATQRFGRKGHSLKLQGPRSVRGGSKRGVELAVYDKADEIEQSAANWRRKRKGDKDEQDRISGYLMALADRLRSVGAVREEQRWHGQQLKRYGYEWAEEWSEKTMHELWEKQALKVAEVGGVVDWQGEAKARLLALGLSDRLAASRLRDLHSWMSGGDVRDGRSRKTFYRIACDLRSACGVDIRDRPNVVTLGSKAQQLARPVTARYMSQADADALYEGLPDWKGAA